MARIKRFTRAGVAQTHNVVPSRPMTYAPSSSSSSSSSSDSDSETERLLTRRRVVRRKRAVPKTKKAPVAPSPTQETDDDFIIQPSAETIMKVTRMVTENECLIPPRSFSPLSPPIEALSPPIEALTPPIQASTPPIYALPLPEFVLQPTALIRPQARRAAEAMGASPRAVLAVLGCIGADLSAFEPVRAGSV